MTRFLIALCEAPISRQKFVGHGRAKSNIDNTPWEADQRRSHFVRNSHKPQQKATNSDVHSSSSPFRETQNLGLWRFPKRELMSGIRQIPLDSIKNVVNCADRLSGMVGGTLLQSPKEFIKLITLSSTNKRFMFVQLFSSVPHQQSARLIF